MNDAIFSTGFLIGYGFAAAFLGAILGAVAMRIVCEWRPIRYRSRLKRDLNLVGYVINGEEAEDPISRREVHDEIRRIERRVSPYKGGN